MNALANLSYDNSIENEQDNLGGFQLRESGVELFTIKLAYFETSANGATGVNCTFEDAAGKTYKETFWATNREGNNYFTTQDGEKRYLAGFLNADALALLTVGTPIGQVPTETLVVKVYNADAKAEVPTQVPALKSMMGKQVQLGILKQRENKSKKNESTNKYEPTSEERHVNVVDKVFRTDGFTTAELRASAEAPEFINAWKERWEGKVKDRYKEVKGGVKAGAPGAAKPRSSMFA